MTDQIFQMQQMQQYNQGGYGGMQGMTQSQFMSHQMSHMNSMSRMGMMGGGGMQPRMQGMMGGPMSGMGMTPNNMPIRAGGPSINPNGGGGMRMPTTMDSRMFPGGPPGAGGRPTPYPNPAMYMAQKRHQSPIYAGGGGPMSHHHHQYLTAARGPYPLPQGGGGGGYPMGHPHNMGGGPGPGFSGMPPVMRHHGGMMGPGGGMPPSMAAMNPQQQQNFPVSAAQGMVGGGGMNSVMNRPGGGGGGGPYPGGPMQAAGGPPGSMFPGGSGRPKADIPTVSPRGGGANSTSGLSPFQHSPVPGNPTPPLTPNGPGNCVSAPFASPQSEHGSSSSGSGSDSKPNFSLASKEFFYFAVLYNLSSWSYSTYRTVCTITLTLRSRKEYLPGGPKIFDYEVEDNVCVCVCVCV